MSRPPPSIVLVDDHPLFRRGLVMMLSAHPRVCAQLHEASSVKEAMGLDVQAGLVLLDISLPGGDGLSSLAALREHWPEARVVILSGHDHAELRRDAERGGASGFLSKALAAEVICDHVLRWLSETPPAHAFDGLPLGDTAATADAGAAHDEVLPPRQYEVLKLLAQGFSNKAIAKQLAVSEHTVRNQVVTILRHFGAQTRTQAVVNAQRRGVLPAVLAE